MRIKNVMLYLSIFCLLLLTLAETGCSGKQPLSGKVTFPDGKPLNCGVIHFVSDSYLSRATIKEDGSFIVGSESEADGIPAGSYKVYIVGAIIEDASAVPEKEKVKSGWKDPDVSASQAKERPMISLIDQKYTSLDSTPLTFTIPGEKLFNFTVNPPAGKKK